LREKDNEEKEEALDDIEEKAKKHYDGKKDKIVKVRKELKKKFKKIKKELDKLRKRLDVDDSIEEYKKLIDVDVSKIIDDITFDLPEPECNEPVGMLLDTNRDYLEQIKFYKEFDIRTKLQEE